MKSIAVFHPTQELNGTIELPSSKSISNRLLILKKVYPLLKIENLSEAADTEILKLALAGEAAEVNVGHAGSAMRFLTAYYACQPKKEVVLTGSERMRKRPIGILVTALRKLGADIEYLSKSGYPPLRIKGKRIAGGKANMKGGVSSQFITALLLVASSFKNGLQITVDGQLVSRPYVQLTVDLMKRVGLNVSFIGNVINVSGKQRVYSRKITIEPDWSSAGFWYEAAALSKKANILLKGLRLDSSQGDAMAIKHFSYLGVESLQTKDGVVLSKGMSIANRLYLDFLETPDLAQAFIVAQAGLGVRGEINGLQTLKIKETDRINALKRELLKCGVDLKSSGKSFEIISGIDNKECVSFETYEDHRMAMSLAMLGLKLKIEMNDPEVVVKSYPIFWKEMQKVGFILEEKLW